MWGSKIREGVVRFMITMSATEILQRQEKAIQKERKAIQKIFNKHGFKIREGESRIMSVKRRTVTTLA